MISGRSVERIRHVVPYFFPCAKLLITSGASRCDRKTLYSQLDQLDLEEGFWENSHRPVPVREPRSGQQPKKPALLSRLAGFLGNERWQRSQPMEYLKLPPL
jgi:hypothetical protein